MCSCGLRPALATGNLAIRPPFRCASAVLVVSADIAACEAAVDSPFSSCGHTTLLSATCALLASYSSLTLWKPRFVSLGDPASVRITAVALLSLLVNVALRHRSRGEM